MISVDTNVLLYSFNVDCPEHDAAIRFPDKCGRRDDVAIAELVLVELYVLLRNPAVLRSPLTAPEAAAVCRAYRTHPRWAVIESAPVMDAVWKLARPSVARRRIFDARLALTLIHHGVDELATRNVGHFRDCPFQRVFDPIAPA